MIRRRLRRAATAATAAALLAAAAAVTAVLVPVAATASSSPVVIDSVSSPASEPGLLSVQVEASSDITDLTVYVNSGGTTDLTIPFSDLSLTSGSAQDGTWTVLAPITTSQLGLGTYQVTVDATAGGTTLTGLSAPEQFFFGLYPSVTIAATTTTLSYFQQSVTVSGQVTAYTPTGVLEDVPDQVVSITGEDGESWPATTDQNGDYARTITPDLVNGTGLAGAFSASVSSSPTIMPASSPSLELTGEVTPVQVSVTLSTSVAEFGTPVTLSGTAEYESGGIWLPLADSPIDVTGTDYYSGNSVPPTAATTDANGVFSVTLPAQPTTTWSANPAASQYLTAGDAEWGLPNSATLTVVLPTRITTLDISYNPLGQVAASGCLGLGTAVSSFPDVTAPARTNLYLQYSRSATGPWRTLGAVDDRKSCGSGTGFSGTVTPATLSGHYRIDFAGQLLYQPSVSATRYAATVPTRFSSFDVTPRAVSGHGRIRVTGQLQQKTHGWKDLGGALITIYIEPAGSTTWYWFRKKVHLSGSGRFSVSFADPGSGHWAVGYAGNSTHLETLSRHIYVTASGTSANLSATKRHSLPEREARALAAR